MNFKKVWWKVLAMGILFYILIAGLMVPLKPGVLGVSTHVLTSGKITQFTVNSYNTVYSKSSPKAYLKLDKTHFLEATSVEALSNKETKLTFDIPAITPGEYERKPMTLLMTDELNGTIVYPDGIILVNEASAGTSSWQTTNVPKLFKKEGFLYPYRNILIETIRNTFYHIPLWFAMFILFLSAMIYSILYLKTKNIDYDHKASSLIYAGILFGSLGLVTGSLWAKNTWGTYWTGDVKLNMSAISMMIYLAYWILRSSMDDIDKKARITAAYSIFAFFTIVPLIFVIPRITDSLHPGNGGNPALGGEDMDNTLRMVFYPAIIGFTLLGVWIAQIILRMKRIRENWNMKMLS